MTYSPTRPVFRSLWRGFARRCPACGQGHFFKGYLSLGRNCSHCGEPLGHIRADDIPPYFTIAIVGHIIVPLILLVEQNAPPPMWLNLVVWPPLALLLTLTLLPKIKGAVVGLMWSLRLSGDEVQ